MTSSLRNLFSSYRLFLIFSVLWILAGQPAFAVSPTATTLTVTSAGSPATSIATNTAVTLTATVASSGTSVTHGIVNFCDASVTYCTNTRVLGSASLTISGKATWKFIPGPGSHSYVAVFQPTAQYASSTSATAALTVSGKVNTASSITSSGPRGNYTLSATVISAAAQAPTGTVSFTDQTEQNSSLGSAPLNAFSGGFALSFKNSTPPDTPSANDTWTAVAVADFNGDGIPDLVYAYYAINPNGTAVTTGTSCVGGVATYLGKGDGSFTGGITSLNITCNPGYIVTGDFNGDGFVDLAFSSDVIYAANGGVVLLGDGTGNFTPASSGKIYLGGNIFAADFNGDGVLDIVNVNTKINTYLGDGTGGFATVAGTPNFTGGTVTDAVAGDFNGDGIPDIAILQDSKEINIYLGVGDGTFVAASTNPYAAGYFQTLGALESSSSSTTSLVASGLGGGSIDILDGLGAYVTYGIPHSSSGGSAFAIGDFNNDGIPDIATMSTAIPANSSSYVEFFIGSNGYSIGYPTYGLAAATSVTGPMIASDLNGDGIPDLISPSGTIILIGNQFSTATISSVVPAPAGTDSHLIAATYSGDGSNTPGLPGLISLQTAQATPQVALTVSPNPVAATLPLALTATVTGNGDQPTGTVDFYRGVTPLGTATLSNGVATATVNAPAAGTYSVTASYLGDTNYDQATSPAVSLTTVTPATPTVTVTSSPTSAVYGTPITITIKVSGSNGVPTGTVDLYKGSLDYETLTLDATGSASVTFSGINSLPAGTTAISAHYAGNTQYTATVSPSINVVVSKEAPTVTISTSTPTPAYGTQLVLTASIPYTGNFPTGTLAFYVDGTLNNTTYFSSNNAGVESGNLITSSLLPGSHSVTVTYSGDNNYTTATSAPFTVTVGKAATTSQTYGYTPQQNTYGSPITLSSRVSGITGLTPTGTITFSYGSVTLGTGTLDATGLATLTPSPAQLPAGSDTITFAYSGDANYLPRTPAAATIAFAKANVGIALASSAATAASGSPVTLSATVTYPASAPTGHVTLYDGSTVIATLTPTNGVAAVTDSSLSAGTHSITASYAGDSNYNSATSSAVSVTIGQDVTVTTAPTNTTSYVGSSNVVNIALAAPAGKPTPTGTITLSGSGYTSAATTLVNGAAAITIPANALPVGNDTLTASYSGDSVYGASTSTFQIAVTSTPPSFVLSGSTLSISPGASTGNTIPITVTPSEGFTGSVTFAAALTASPAGALDPPTFSFGSSSPVSLAGKPATATLTVTTTAPSTSTASLLDKGDRQGSLTLYAAGATVLGCLALFAIPARKRRLRTLFAMLFCLGLYAGLTACGGSSSSSGGSGSKSSPGTTAGAYTIQVTATSGSITTNTSINLTIQ